MPYTIVYFGEISALSLCNSLGAIDVGALCIDDGRCNSVFGIEGNNPLRMLEHRAHISPELLGVGL